MISPIVVRQRADGRWVADCRSPHCSEPHQVAVERTAGAAQEAADPHLREVNRQMDRQAVQR